MSATTLAAVDAARIDALAAELAEILGEAGVTREEQVLERSSLDGSYLSPLISEQLPLGRAQLVAFPASAQQIAETVAAAVRHGVPITPRGKGTGNYGQGIPMAGGLVLDTTKARAVVEVGDGFIVAEAGAPMIQIEQAANRAGQQLLMYPSTVQSTLGGFLSGGSGGTGSIAHGVLMHGFVRAIDVVFASPEPELVHFEGVEAEKYLHNYGVVAIIARAEVVLEPLQEWRAFYASFDDYHTAFQLGASVGGSGLVDGDHRHDRTRRVVVRRQPGREQLERVGGPVVSLGEVEPAGHQAPASSSVVSSVRATEGFVPVSTSGLTSFPGLRRPCGSVVAAISRARSGK